MPKFAFNKLVRDKIVDHQLASGQKPKYRHLARDEHLRALAEKLVEEARELADASDDQRLMELADVQQIIDDLMALRGFTREQLRKAQAAKNAKNGAFRLGVFVESVEQAEDSEWTRYYRSVPDRYPEVND